jgi:hypothetical protein
MLASPERSGVPASVLSAAVAANPDVQKRLFATPKKKRSGTSAAAVSEATKELDSWLDTRFESEEVCSNHHLQRC